MKKISLLKKLIYLVLSLIILAEIFFIDLLPMSLDARDKDRTFVVLMTMTRVGSTKIYNTIRKIYEVSGNDYYTSFMFLCDVNYCYDYNNPSLIHIIKAHRETDLRRSPAMYEDYKLRKNNRDIINPNTKVYWITATRDPRDMMASRVRIAKKDDMFLYPFNHNNFIEVEKELNKSLQTYYAFRKVSDYEVNYELFMQAPEIVIKELAQALGKELNDAQIQEIKLYIEETGSIKSLQKFNNKELEIRSLLPKHITSDKIQGGYKDTLSPEIIEQINIKFSKEIRDMGYSPDSSLR